MSHPATKKFPPVDQLPTEKLADIVHDAPDNWLQRTSREKDALRELRRRRREVHFKPAKKGK